MMYETPMDHDVLEAYLNKSSGYNRADARKIKRALNKLSLYA
jgi:hypothetical protein